ncbi:MAG TPA: hypothetical protein VMN57_00875 [Anaerolineales bacterium]|nr:hypothetical protein [Anaerolineales bacterium]
MHPTPSSGGRRSAACFRHIIVFTAGLLIILACRQAGPGTPMPAATAAALETTTGPTPTVFPSETAGPPTPTGPVATETPEPKILFRETFDDDLTCFKLHSLEPGIELAIRDGAYRVRVDGDTAINLPCRGGYDDFVMSFDLAFAEAGPQSLVGFAFRSYVGTSYNIYFTGSAEFCWDHADFRAEAFRILAGCWLQLPDIVTSGETLRLSVVAAQERMAILIDGFLLAAVTDTANDYGSFGFFVLNDGPGVTEIVIDNILIRELIDNDLEFFREDQTGF